MHRTNVSGQNLNVKSVEGMVSWYCSGCHVVAVVIVGVGCLSWQPCRVLLLHSLVAVVPQWHLLLFLDTIHLDHWLHCLLLATE